MQAKPSRQDLGETEEEPSFKQPVEGSTNSSTREEGLRPTRRRPTAGKKVKKICDMAGQEAERASQWLWLKREKQWISQPGLISPICTTLEIIVRSTYEEGPHLRLSKEQLNPRDPSRDPYSLAYMLTTFLLYALM